MTQTAVSKDRHKRNTKRLIILFVEVLIAIAFYLLINSQSTKPALFLYIVGLRLPALLCMVIASASIGVATLIFQSIVNNCIVTPEMLGMNAIYSFLHTAVVVPATDYVIIVPKEHVDFYECKRSDQKLR